MNARTRRAVSAASAAILLGLTAGLAPPDPGIAPPEKAPVRFHPTICSSNGHDEEWSAEWTIWLFWDDDYGGEAIEFRIWRGAESGEYKLDLAYPGSWWNNRLSSFGPESDIGEALWWLYDDHDCQEDSFLLEGRGGCNDVNPYNDDMSSLRIACNEDESRCYLYLYEDEDQKGKCLPFKLYKFGTTDHIVLEICALDGHWNDDISSIQTDDQGGGEYEWLFYNDKNFNDGDGANFGLENGDDAPDLGDYDLNDEFSSMRLIIHQ